MIFEGAAHPHSQTELTRTVFKTYSSLHMVMGLVNVRSSMENPFARDPLRQPI
jgi:hypothetical protein